MGCGASSRNTKRQRDDYYDNNRGYDYRNTAYNNRQPQQYRDPSRDDPRYHGYDDNNLDDDNYRRQAPEMSRPARQQSYDDSEDVTPFDDDDVRDNEKYHKIDNGLFIKAVDFRSRFVDEDNEQRPQISSGNLFVDTEFPLKTALRKDHGHVEFKRPKDFLEDPKLFSDGATRFDIGQGTAGTCWFLSMVANLAGDKNLMKQVIPQDAYNIENPSKYDGVFHARFYKFGKWDNIFIDDYLPVIHKNQLWGAKSVTDENELWVSLLEKAFAKMHGSYDAIYGGQPGDAYLQLTGGIGERVEHKENKQGDTAAVFYNRIKNALSSGSQVSCLVLDEYDNFKGLVGGHAYSVIGVFEDKASRAKLIKLRNPWGKGEWKGPWSDGSSEWSSIPNSTVIAPKKDDGEFYVSIQDFMKYFSQTTICSLTPDFDCDGISDPLNHVLSIYGEWNGKTAAGYHNLLQNQRFCFTVPKSGLVNNNYMPLVIQIVQQSKTRKTDTVSIRCDVFKVLADRIQQKCRNIAVEIQGTKNNVYTPELQATFRHKLKPGRYIIIASSADKNHEKAFLLRLFTPAPLENIKEVPINADIVSCEKETFITIKGQTHELTFDKALFGEFVKGHNAGGQVSNVKSYHLNPQYLITIPETGSEIPLVVHVMQSHKEKQQPIGVKIYKMDNTVRPPVDIKYLYDHYDNSPADLDGSKSKFATSSNVEIRALLRPGRYIALVYLDEPNVETSYCILFKSTVHVGIKGYQTG